MKKKIIVTVIIIILIILSFIVVNSLKTKKEYSSNIFYMDTYIYVKLYSSDSTKANKALTEVEKIYKEYHELTDRYNHYDNITNVYDIYHNDIDTETLTLDSKLYDLLKYADDWHKQYNKFNIEIGNIIDVWKKYRDSEVGIPTIDELNGVNNITSLTLLENNQILNNHPNLDLGSVAKGYTTEFVGKYLESIGINDYLINAGGNVKVGSNIKNKNYKIGIQSPVNSSDLLTVVNGQNISVITSGGYERNYEYNGTVYHHIIDPDTLYPSNYFKGISVITKDSALGDLLSTTLFLMNIEDGTKLIKEYGVEAIWYTNDNQVIRSENFNSYE